MSEIPGTFKWYLAGPMKGVLQLNFPLFDEVAYKLRSHGYNIVSPAELDNDFVREKALESKGEYTGTHTQGEMLSRDVQIVANEVDGIIFLPDWKHSAGARLEAYVGLMTDKTFAEYKNGSFVPMNRSDVAYHVRVRVK